MPKGIFYPRSKEGEKRRLASMPKGKDHWRYDHYNIRAIHRWINKYYGKADRCEDPNCKNISAWFEWALIKGRKYLRKRENYKTTRQQGNVAPARGGQI